MTSTKTLELIWTATAEWLDVAERQGLQVDWDSDPIDGNDWDDARRMAEQDPEETEGGFATLVEPRECDTLLRAGDIIATTGPGGDVAFLRNYLNSPRKMTMTTTTHEASIEVCGDRLSVTWTGSVWQAPSNGTQHARVWDALAVELRAYLSACGEDISEIDGQYVRDNYTIDRS